MFISEECLTCEEDQKIMKKRIVSVRRVELLRKSQEKLQRVTVPTATTLPEFQHKDESEVISMSSNKTLIVHHCHVTCKHSNNYIQKLIDLVELL